MGATHASGYVQEVEDDCGEKEAAPRRHGVLFAEDVNQLTPNVTRCFAR